MTLVGKSKLLFPLFIYMLLSCGIVDEKKVDSSYYKIKGSAQGTTFSIIFKDSLSRDFSTEIDSLLNKIDLQLSTYDTNSIISRFNMSDKNSYPVDGYDLFIKCFNRSKYFHKKTNGYFNAAIFPLTEYWGFHKNSEVKIDTNFITSSIIPLIRMDSIYIFKNIDGKTNIFKSNPDSKLDFNAIAQGYSVDLVAEYLISNGIENFMVEIGGEVRAKGVNSKGNIWRIGIERPIEDSFVGEYDFQKIISLENKSLATSGNYRKYKKINGNKVSHSINPLTGLAVNSNLLSVSVITDFAIDADALATSFLVMGIEKSSEFIKKDTNILAYFIYDSAGKYKEWSNF